jgi:catechol 2,3-dioxygenase-like lactoylglutathione lyase family enzyme
VTDTLIGGRPDLAARAPWVSEVTSVVVGVSNPDAAARLFEDALGFQRHRHDAFPTDSPASRLLGTTQAMTSVLVGPPGESSGLVRLVGASGVGVRIWGDYSTPQDRGYYALNFVVSDVDAAWEQLVACGAHPRSRPKAWALWADLTVREAMFLGPDGVLLDVAEVSGAGARRHNDPVRGRSSAICAVTSHVADPSRSRRFYESLGYALFFDQELRGLEELLHLPRGTVLRDVNLRVPGRPLLGRLELVAYVGLAGAARHGLAVPPNLGIHAATFRTRSLEDALAMIVAQGGSVLVREPACPFGELGKGRAARCSGPDGETLILAELD